MKSVKEPIIGWARLLNYAGIPYCAVLTIDPHGSVVTACSGRWRSSEPAHYLPGRDRDVNDEGREFKKCGACDDVARDQRTNDGLRELAATPVRTRADTWPMAASEFDLSDLGGEQ